jgi:hypothetical protein
MAGRVRAAAPLVGVALISLVLGGLVFGNLFTFVTREYGGVGPGYGQSIGVKVDTTVVVNTVNPEYYMQGMARTLSPLTRLIWTITGKMWVESDDTYSIFWSRHAGTLLDDGKDFIEKQVSGVPGTVAATYVALSSDATSPAAGWSRIYSEINTGGSLDRVNGTYASTGVGAWTVTKQFTADGAYTNVQLTGLCWSDTDASNDTTIAADTFTATTLANGDKITITWTVSVT